MKAKKTSSKPSNKKVMKKKSEPILLKKVNNINKLFTKKDIKNIVDSIINRDPL